jgi:hypothetical protein
MDLFPFIIGAIFIFVGGRFIYGRIKHGSWTGAFLGGSIDRTFGELQLSKGAVSSQTLKVVSLRDRDGREDFVGLVFTAKAPMGASMQPFKLTKLQAQELASYLSMAAK